MILDINFNKGNFYFLFMDKSVNLNVWDYFDLKNYLGLNHELMETEGFLHTIKGFDLLRLEIIDQLDRENEFDYSKAEGLTSFEIQNEKKIKTSHYSKSVAAFHKDDLVGITILKWGKNEFPFFNYKFRIVDVHNDYRNQGIATRMIQFLDKSSFLKNKILTHGEFSPDGYNYLEKIMERELHAKDYALLYPDYYENIPPTNSGIYNYSD